MLLWACPVSMLGLAYLLLIAALLIAPPQRGRYVERDARGRNLEAPSRAPALILAIQRYELGARQSHVSMWQRKHAGPVPNRCRHVRRFTVRATSALTLEL